MKVNCISQTNFTAGAVRINAETNKEVQYLYNKVINLTNEFKIPATFHTHEIELPSTTEAIIKRLNELGIKYGAK